MLVSGKPALVRLKRNVSLTFTKIEVGLLESFIQPNHGYLQASSRNSIDFTVVLPFCIIGQIHHYLINLALRGLK